MERYNFDEVIDRRNCGALKVDALAERFGREDLQALWVADMDFKTPDFVMEAIKEVCACGVLGYPSIPTEYKQTVAAWQKERHNWRVEEEWIDFIPGVVKGLVFSVMHFTRPGDKVVIQPPVYFPFSTVPKNLGREVVCNPLLEEGGTYRMDLEGLEAVLDENCKLLILCNPHNPIGITWEADTLRSLAELCERKGVLVVSDEIHGDMALFGHRHLPYASVSEAAKQHSITLSAPSKTFNMAGLISSYCIIPNDALREGFFSFLNKTEWNHMHSFAGVSCIAAYQKGTNWLEQMLAYVEDNIRFTQSFLQKHLPAIQVVVPQASFLVWLDCRELGLTQAGLVRFFVEEAGLALNDGASFGTGGAGFMRLNVACARSRLQLALECVVQAYEDRNKAN